MPSVTWSTEDSVVLAEQTGQDVAGVAGDLSLSLLLPNKGFKPVHSDKVSSGVLL